MGLVGCSAHAEVLEVDSSIRRRRSEIRAEDARREGRESENLNNGVKPKNTGPVMGAAV